MLYAAGINESGFLGSSQMVFMTKLIHNAAEIFQAQSLSQSKAEKTKQNKTTTKKTPREFTAHLSNGCLFEMVVSGKRNFLVR